MPVSQITPYETDARLREKLAEIEALVEAIAAEEPDCDLKLAELLEGEPDQVRLSIIEKLREMLKERAAEQQQILDRHLQAQQQQEATRKRGLFLQWLQWIMSEETLRRMREAFLAAPMLEGLVRGVGRTLNRSGVQNAPSHSPAQDLGNLSHNLTQSAAQARENERNQKGRG